MHILAIERERPIPAQSSLPGLPLVKSGLIEFTLQELRTYDGFERLFSTGTEPSVPMREEPAEY